AAVAGQSEETDAVDIARDVARAIGGTVVDDDDLGIDPDRVQGHGAHLLQQCADEALFVVRRNDDRQRGHQCQRDVRCASTRASSSGVFTPTASMSSVAVVVTTVPRAAACGMNGRKLRSPVTASALAAVANAGRSTLAAWADIENSPMSLSPRAGMTCPSRRCLTPTMR